MCLSRIQILNIPPDGMLGSLGEKLGKLLGKVLEVEVDAQRRCWGMFMRVWVLC